MSYNGMYQNSCSCSSLDNSDVNSSASCPDEKHLTLLSAIPNQKVYRCNQCHSFLAFTEDNAHWEVLLQGNAEDEIRNLYEQPSLQVSAG